MKIKTSELTGPALDWAVAKCESVEVEYLNDGITRCLLQVSPFTGRYSPSTNPAQAWPIIERLLSQGAEIRQGGPKAGNQRCWFKLDSQILYSHGPNLLIAAMRCHVTSELGDEVEVPEELLS